MTKFTVGMEGVKTRDGHPVRILCIDAPGPYPIVGYTILEGDPDPCHYTWTKDGRYRDEHADSRDLVPPKQIQKFWLNVYKASALSHLSREEAIAHAGRDCLKVAHLVEVEL